MKRIGFIGVGKIGAPMARCVARAGFELMVCDTSAEARADFAALAARITDRAGDCADQDMIIVMVTNDEQVQKAMLGDDGILPNVDPEQAPAVAIMSTVMPQTIQSISAACASKNVALIDAPVSGQRVLAEQGKLSIMVGGTQADLESMRPVLEAMGDKIYHTGALGSGQVTKLINNMLGLTNLFLTVEAMQVGLAYGMDLAILANVLEASSGRNFSTQDWERSKATLTFLTENSERIRGALDLARKDLAHAQELSSKAGVTCPLFEQIVQAFHAFSYDEIEERWREVAGGEARM